MGDKLREADIDAAYGRAFGVGSMPRDSREWFALGYRAALDAPAAPQGDRAEAIKRVADAILRVANRRFVGSIAAVTFAEVAYDTLRAPAAASVSEARPMSSDAAESRTAEAMREACIAATVAPAARLMERGYGGDWGALSAGNALLDAEKRMRALPLPPCATGAKGGEDEGCKWYTGDGESFVVLPRDEVRRRRIEAAQRLATPSRPAPATGDVERATLPTRGDVGRPEATRDPVFLLRYRVKGDKPDKNRWHVDSVWFTREEAEAFAAHHAHRWGTDLYGPRWHVYCVPSNGDLAALLKSVTKREALAAERARDEGRASR